MAPTQSAVLPFKESYPLNFSLRNVDEQEVLYIDDIGETLHLEIRNTSGAPIRIPPSRAGSSIRFPSGPVKRLFELRFRPGTLAEDGKKITLFTKSWQMVWEKGTDGVVSLAFINEGNQVTLPPGGSLTLTLENVMASANGGSRSTRVELHYRDIFCGSSTTPLTGSRVQHMTILNRHGREHIPLHVGFVESNRILNNGTTVNSLLLRVTNTMKRDPVYPERSTITLRGGEDAPSKLIFSFIAGSQEMEWALGTPDQIGKILVGSQAEPAASRAVSFSPGTAGPAAPIKVGAVEKGFVKPVKQLESEPSSTRVAFDVAMGDLPYEEFRQPNISVVGNEIYYSLPQDNWITKVEQEGETPEWVLTPAGVSVELEAEEFIQFYFTNIVTGHPSGLTNLYVYYKNIPGYWDGQFICPIEKTQLVVVEGEVGIGTAEPQATLDVNGDVLVAGKLQAQAFTGATLDVSVGVKVAGEVEAQSFTGNGAVPPGVIVLWSGELDKLPEGWDLCDGSNGALKLIWPGPEPVFYIMKK